MKEHFLTYNQSLAVKELGFPQNDYLAWFDSRNILYFDSDYVSKDYAPTCCSAPLKSQFFKWVRDKYDIFIPINHYSNGYSIGYDIRRFDTYEQAEDACINKIIELKKNENESKIGNTQKEKLQQN